MSVSWRIKSSCSPMIRGRTLAKKRKVIDVRNSKQINWKKQTGLTWILDISPSVVKAMRHCLPLFLRYQPQPLLPCSKVVCPMGQDNVLRTVAPKELVKYNWRFPPLRWPYKISASMNILQALGAIWLMDNPKKLANWQWKAVRGSLNLATNMASYMPKFAVFPE